MPGMNSGLDGSVPLIVAAFRTALLHQGLIALLVIAIAGAAWAGLRARQDPGPVAQDEPAARRVLRIGFGLLWLFDGILQAQPGMPTGLLPQGIEPAALSSSAWVRHVVNWGGTAWTYHPVQAGAAAVWIQVGLGIWLLAAPRGSASRLAGLASVGWGLVVWVFGEAFGGIFAPGLTWLTGAPGAVLVYVVAGALIALPARAWLSPRLGQLTLAGLGVFLAVMAGVQARPGTGFWQGTSSGQPGTLAAMAQSMAQTPQPRFLSGWVSAFAAFDTAHGFAVNLFVVVALTVIAFAFVSGRPRLIRPALAGFTVLCLVDWILIQDLGFLGGVGTDPNSMIPFILLAAGGYLALTCSNQKTQEAQETLTTREPRRARVTAGLRQAAALGAVGLIALGTTLMSLAQASPNADPILAESIARPSAQLNYPAPGFTLTSQYGKTVSLSSLRGKVLLLSFLNPACQRLSCPAIGPEFRQAARLLGGDQVELAGVVLSPTDRSVRALQAFDQREGLDLVPGWLYLTGTLAQLRQVWHEYGAASQDEIYVIDSGGHIRQKYGTGAGPGTAATDSSFAVLFADAARHAMEGAGPRIGLGDGDVGGYQGRVPGGLILGCGAIAGAGLEQIRHRDEVVQHSLVGGLVDGRQQGAGGQDLPGLGPHDPGIGLEDEVVGDGVREAFCFQGRGQVIDVVVERHLRLSAGRVQPDRCRVGGGRDRGGRVGGGRGQGGRGRGGRGRGGRGGGNRRCGGGRDGSQTVVSYSATRNNGDCGDCGGHST
jgi:cytochrome oxidase Cu insertion factor (SCO1/SenC/PrrC family)